MSKDAKVTFAQAMGTMFISGLLVVMGWFLGVITGYNMKDKEDKT